MNTLEVRNAPATAADQFVSVDGIVDHNGGFENFSKELVHQTDIIKDRFEQLKDLARETLPTGKWAIHFGTGNHGKIDEFNNFLAVSKHLKEIGVPDLIDFAVLGKDRYEEIEENGKTFYDNCFLKSNGLSALERNQGLLVMAEDSGIAIDILDGRPGVHSARFMYEPQNLRLMTHLQYENPAIAEHIQHIWAKAPTKSVAKKNEVDFINQICLIEAVRNVYIVRGQGSLLDITPTLQFPAHFVTTASISHRGRLKQHAAGHMYGKLVVPTAPDYSDPKFLHALSRDFGYNAIFGVEDRATGETVMLSKVSLKDRLRWNHRSIALTRVIVAFLFEKALTVG
jgi:inosine/xanthosine triphosphate pyrophosphatase family protein